MPDKEPLVLLVDDDPEFLEAGRRKLMQAGLVPITAKSVEAAKLALVADFPYVLLCDWNLGSQTAFDLYEHLAGYDHPFCFFCLITAHQEEEIKERSISQGILFYYQKPLRWLELVPQVQSMIKQAKAVRLQRMDDRKLVQSLLNLQEPESMVQGVIMDLSSGIKKLGKMLGLGD